jgi:hypothetical protein
MSKTSTDAAGTVVLAGAPRQNAHEGVTQVLSRQPATVIRCRIYAAVSLIRRKTAGRFLCCCPWKVVCMLVGLSRRMFDTNRNADQL